MGGRPSALGQFVMKYRKLTIENFGPYCGSHSIDFNSDSGVWVIYGENGRGKTSLLNAFRYALYGKVFGRRGERPLLDMANRHAVARSGTREFKVILEIDHLGSSYSITRAFRNGHRTCIVERNGQPLSDRDAGVALLTIAPESISQFFLFDGELLRQYEDLREPDADSGRQMRVEVDRLLGVQALERAIADVREVGVEAAKEKAKALASQKKAQNLAIGMQEATAKRDALTHSLAELKSKERQHERRLGELEEELAKDEQARAIIGQIDQLTEAKTKIELKFEQAKNDLKDAASNAWRAVLQPAVTDRLTAISAELEAVNARRVEAHVSHSHARHIERHQECPVCDTVLDEAKRDAIIRRSSSSGTGEQIDRLDELVQVLRYRVKLMGELQDPGVGAVIAEREKAVRRLRLELEENRNDIRAREDSLGGIDSASVRRRQRERDDIKVLLSKDRDAIGRTNDDIAEQDVAIDGFRKALREENVTTDPVLEARDYASSKLLRVFERALDEYQRELITRVEAIASDVFTAIRSEEGYARLRIRDGYGLSIVAENGVEVTGHSAGYEHLVALSLIAALQRSSPVQGPVVMDSPFGRLDHGHTRKSVAALPKIAEQVVLLAFEGEFDRDSAFADLGDAFVGEYVLRRVDTDHTTIERRS
jgi:DNA sulfur modification protein DndD